jgi:hypothetical protein
VYLWIFSVLLFLWTRLLIQKVPAYQWLWVILGIASAALDYYWWWLADQPYSGTEGA